MGPREIFQWFKNPLRNIKSIYYCLFYTHTSSLVNVRDIKQSNIYAIFLVRLKIDIVILHYYKPHGIVFSLHCTVDWKSGNRQCEVLSNPSSTRGRD